MARAVRKGTRLPTAACLCLFATIALVTGCGQEERGSQPNVSAEGLLSVDEVRERFREVTGDELELTPFPAELEGVLPHVAYLSSRRIEETGGAHRQGGEDATRLEAKYGDFLIAVYRDDVPELDGESPSTEGQGMRWVTLMGETGSRGEYVGAQRVYGRNIQLRWYPESGKRETTVEWDRLDSALSELVKRAKSR